MVAKYVVGVHFAAVQEPIFEGLEWRGIIVLTTPVGFKKIRDEHYDVYQLKARLLAKCQAFCAKHNYWLDAVAVFGAPVSSEGEINDAGYGGAEHDELPF